MNCLFQCFRTGFRVPFLGAFACLHCLIYKVHSATLEFSGSSVYHILRPLSTSFLPFRSTSSQRLPRIRPFFGRFVSIAIFWTSVNSFLWKIFYFFSAPFLGFLTKNALEFRLLPARSFSSFGCCFVFCFII